MLFSYVKLIFGLKVVLRQLGIQLSILYYLTLNNFL